MQCERCKEAKATVFLTQVINGVMHKVDLCEKCAKEMGVSENSAFSLADLLLQMGEGVFDQMMKDPEEGIICPDCGYTQSDFRKTGRLGCEKCYEVFSALLSQVLDEFQKSSQHRGKVPSRRIQDAAQDQHLADLEKQLAEAIKKEHFEEAAWIRDQIRSLSAKV